MYTLQKLSQRGVSMKIFLTFLFISVALIPAISMASSFGGGGGKGFESGLFWGADLNRDERLDRNEAKAVFNLAEDEIFTRYDKDESGFITRLEFSDYVQQAPWVDKFVHPKDR